MKRSLAILALPALALGLSAQTTSPTVKTIVKNGDSKNRYDIVILGDGYQASEQSTFDSNCTSVVNKLFATEPYKTFKFFFNVHTVFRASKQSGADHPDASPPIVKDTVYDASYNTGGTGRCLYIKNSSQALKDAALAPAVEGRVMVIVNDSRYGGCASTFAVTYNGSSMTTVQAHEFGHSFGLLADEYDYPNLTYTGGEPGQVNVTVDKTGKTKWGHWLGYNGVSAYEGARYYKYGIWRPKSNCLMRSLGAPLCEVCMENIVKQAYVTTNAIENPVPSAIPVKVDPGNKQTFSFTNIASSSSTITWKVDGSVISGTGTSNTIDTTPLGYGDHKVTVEVQDKTAFVRNDPVKRLVSEHTWTLSINSPPLPDLSPALGLLNKSFAAGEILGITSWLQNAGTATSPVSTVEFFLSKDKTPSSDDVVLHEFTMPAVAPYSAYTPGSSVHVPAFVPAGSYYFGIVMDRQNAVKELLENNNAWWTEVTVTSLKGCTGHLSYNDPFTPASSAVFVGKNGGTLDPVVDAPCNKGDGYLILLGCSGTTPGVTLYPNLALPLNIDAWTSAFYSAVALGDPMLAGFLGTLDATGRGKAKLTVPAGNYGTVKGHFAAVVFDLKTGAFKNTTNAIEIDFR